jgi:DNA-binding GntR family transcriptional regulator
VIEAEECSTDNWALHRTIYSTSDERYLLEELETIWRKTDRYLQLISRATGVPRSV